MKEFSIDRNTEGQRIDRYLSDELEDRSRSYIQKIMKEGYVKVNQKPVKSNYRLSFGDSVEVTLPEAKEPDIVPENIPLDILYEDQDLLVVNKPAGMVTHPSGSHYQDSISNLLAAYFREKNETTRIRSIGRLDKETSGILLFARNQVAAARLQKQREEGKLQKKYLALAEGDLSEANDSVFWKEIAIPLAPDPENPMKMTISPDGLLPGSRNAVTYYKNIKSFGNVTLVELQLETGRTHQIRVHMAGIGHPLLGDTMYNPRACLKNHFHNLHAPLCGIFCPNSVAVVTATSPSSDLK